MTIVIKEIIRDIHGVEIKAGDTIYNPYDANEYYVVVANEDGDLFLEHFDCPLEKYSPEFYWEIV